jgi:hypothetical protein
MRPLIFAVATLLVNIAFQLTMAKYGADVPDGAILALWVMPLVPFGWWVWTHDKLLSRREKIKQYFRLHLWKSIAATVATILIVLACVAGIGYTGWKMLNVRHENESKGIKPLQQTATPESSASQTLADDPSPRLSASPTKLIFKDQSIGTTSESHAITVVNRGTTTRILSPLRMTGDFSQTNDCGPELMVGDSCEIAVSFAPTKLGLIYGSLEIPSSDPLSPNVYTNPATVTFSGSGSAARHRNTKQSASTQKQPTATSPMSQECAPGASCR